MIVSPHLVHSARSGCLLVPSNVLLSALSNAGRGRTSCVVLVSGIWPLINRLVLVTKLSVTGSMTRMFNIIRTLGPPVNVLSMMATDLFPLSTSTCVPDSTGHVALPGLIMLLCVPVRLSANLMSVVLGKENIIRGMALLSMGPGLVLVTPLVTATFRLKVWRVSVRFGATLFSVYMLLRPACLHLLMAMHFCLLSPRLSEWN